MADVTEAIQASFEELGIAFDKDITDKCVELCLEYGFDDAEELVDSWMAYSLSHLQGANPTLQHLARFERETLAKKSKADVSNNELHSAYCATPQSKTRTPESARTKAHLHSPRDVFSPVSFSPGVGTPSSKYTSRLNAGSILCERPISESLASEISQDISLHLISESHGEKYMSFSLVDHAEAVEKQHQRVIETLSSRYNIEEIVPVVSKHPVSVVTAGRIICDADGKLNTESTLLEGSPNSGGDTVKLDLSMLPVYSIFPGQMVAVEGLNVSGNKFVAQKIWCDASISLPPPTVSLPGCLKIIVACGPFTPSDSLTFQPLLDLIDVVQKEEPHLLILTGPCVDSEHPAIKDNTVAETYDEYFARLCEQIMKPLSGLRTEVALVSSFRDCHGAAVFPTPAYAPKQQLPKLSFLPDPCIIDVEGLHVAITSVDVLMHLGKEELSWPTHSSDRLARLAAHILQQQSFYPLRPPAVELPLDPTCETQLTIATTPHLLIVPSDLRCFIKESNNCTIVNPEHLAKGLVGGSYAKLNVAPNGCISGQIIKI